MDTRGAPRDRHRLGPGDRGPDGARPSLDRSVDGQTASSPARAGAAHAGAQAATRTARGGAGPAARGASRLLPRARRQPARGDPADSSTDSRLHLAVLPLPSRRCQRTLWSRGLSLHPRPHGQVARPRARGPRPLLSRHLSSPLGLVSTRTLDGGKRKLMLFLPLVFVGVAARFPAGLLVYWITSSLWTFGQQVVLMRARAATPSEEGPVTPRAVEADVGRHSAHPVSKKKHRGRRRRP